MKHLDPEEWYGWQLVTEWETQPAKTQERIYLLIAENPAWKPNDKACIEQIGMMHLQWVQGQRLIAGYKKKLEPEASEYVEQLIGTIQKVHGEHWAMQVQKWFWQYLIDESEAKAA